MKKKIAALVLGALLSVSAAAMAATPDAEMMSTQQEKAAAWVDTMLVKNDPAASLKLMGAEAQKEIDVKKATAIHQDMDKNLGKYKGGRFCVFLFDKKGNLQNFALSPVKQTAEKKDEKKK